MTPEQRSELKRRYDDFVRHFAKSAPKKQDPAKPDRRVQPWAPGKRRPG
jgi:hypothetical protein